MSSLNAVHFKFLPMSTRVLFSMVLLVFGLAYCMAMIQVWVTHVGLDGKAYLTAKDLMISYSGNKEGTKMETALKGPMAAMLDEDNKKVVFTWLHKGASKDDYDKTIQPIIQDHCVACHNKEANANLPDYTTWEGVQKVVATDTGMTIPTLVRVSHIHLFSITFIFFIVGFIFTHAYVRPLWFKCVVIAIPFLSLISDVASWYLTKLWDGFAWMVIISGAFMGTAFTIMWFLSMWQMWIGKVPEGLSEDGKVPCISN
jgi:cytochrome c553